MNEEKKQDRRAAIVCYHIAHQHLPILRAIRDEPEMEEDSGWQFLCGRAHNESSDDAQVWLIYELLKYDPSLSELIEYQPKVIATRENVNMPWIISAQGKKIV